MVEFKKGYWNLKELEIQEWIDTKTKGFITEDIETFCKRLKKEVRSLGLTYTTKQVIELINKLSGFKNDAP